MKREGGVGTAALYIAFFKIPCGVDFKAKSKGPLKFLGAWYSALRSIGIGISDVICVVACFGDTDGDSNI